MRSFKRAFTLIELLVVIAIIALLLSILMPALTKAKDMARRVVCGSNNKQLMLGMMTYAADYKKGPYLLGVPGGSNWGNNGTKFPFSTYHWSDATGFYPGYVAEPKLYYCPSDRSSTNTPQKSAKNYGKTTWGGAKVLGSTYRYVGQFSGSLYPFFNPRGGGPEALKPVPDEMKFVVGSHLGYYKPGENYRRWLIAEDTRHDQGAVHNSKKTGEPRSAKDKYGFKWTATDPYKADGENVGFVDGHVEWLGWDKVMDYTVNWRIQPRLVDW